jgi:predicted PurR-regulated permease PerM
MPSDKSKETFSRNIQKRIWRVEITPLTVALAVLVVGSAWLLIQLSPVLLVLIAALMIVGTLNPAVEWLETRGIRRGAGIAIVFSVFLLIVILFVTLTFPALMAQVKNLIEQEPDLRARLANFLAGYQLTESLADTLRNFQYDALIKSSGAAVLAFSTRLLEIFAYSACSFFLALYIMIDRDRLRGAVFAVVPRSHHIRLSRILLNLETIVGGYIRGQVITCVLMGVFMFILLTACGIPNALAFAVFGGIADVLPFIGVFLTMGPAVLASLAKGPVIIAIVFILMLCYEEFESRVLIPIVYGRALRLPSSVVLFALIAGGTLAGITGALLALPLAATILMLIDELRVELPGEQIQLESVEIKKTDERGEAEYERRTKGIPAEQAAAVAVEISGNRQKEEKNESQTKPIE